MRYACSENESSQQIHGIIGAGVAIRAIIVIYGAVETGISGILDAKLDVLHGKKRETGDVPGASGVAIGAAAHRTLRIQQGVDGPAGIEPSDCSGKAIAEMVLGVGENCVQ